MYEILKFIRRLQNEDEAVKRKWLVVMSAGAMALVIILWFVYIKYAFVGFGTQPAETEKGDSFWQTFAAGLNIVSEQVRFWWRTGNDMLVQGNVFNFTAENVKPVPPTPLP